jgi:hypothetical protein
VVDGILIFWILLFVIFLIIHLIVDSTTFGMICGFWLMILGLAIVITGVQIQTGVNITDTSVTNIYQDMVLPFSTYSLVWGVSLIAISMYMVIANAMRRIG